MDQTLERYIQQILPYRLYALRIFRVALLFVEQYPEGGRYECRVKDKLVFEGKSTAITNPSIEMGIIHSRVLLEFLGLGIVKGQTLGEATSRKDDINIKSFGLPIVTREQALSPCTGDKTMAEAAFVETVTAANKLVAHSTEVMDQGSDAVNSYLMCCDAIPVLFKQYFYKPLEMQFPNIDISSRPSDS